ncbi:hypothetical protein ACFX13_032062 [Malus domestica]
MDQNLFHFQSGYSTIHSTSEIEGLENKNLIKNSKALARQEEKPLKRKRPGYVPEAEEEKPLMRLLCCRKSRFGGGEDSSAAIEVRLRVWVDLQLPIRSNCRPKTLEFLILG